MVFTLTSPSIPDGGKFPAEFTCDGDGRSPALAWDSVPRGARSLTLLLHDPDSTMKPDFTHWLAYDIPVASGTLIEGGDLGLSGLNDFGGLGYGGPCPSVGEHCYVFELYALDRESLGLPAGATRADVEAAMEDHLLGRACLLARYRKLENQ